MTFKRNRTNVEKINDCLDNRIMNLHPSMRESLFLELQSLSISSCVGTIRKYVINKLSLPANGSNGRSYWIARGWSEIESGIKVNNVRSTYEKRLSPYSREFWTTKINPKTNVFYTIEEADFERNSRRPIRKEYWISKGFSEEESIEKALSTKTTNNKIGNSNSAQRDEESIRASSQRCREYWILRGFSEEEVEENITKLQTTFSLEKCIDESGVEEGTKRWKERQEKWQNTLKCKPLEEQERITRAKFSSNNTGYSNISQKLFVSIYNKLQDKQVYFATLNNDVNKNNEYFYRSKTENRSFFFDFYYPAKKRIIEFDGDYWHGESRGNIQRDIERQLILESEGFEFLRIKEREYNMDKQGTIDACLKFLTM